MEEKIKELFYDPLKGFVSAEKLHQKLKELGYNYPLKQIQTILKKQKVNQVFKPIQKQNYISIIADKPKHIFQADLLDVHQSAKFNDGNKWILVLIDVYSRYAIAIPMKNKNEEDIKYALELAFDKMGEPQNLTTDLEPSIMGKTIQTFLGKKEINHFAVEPERKRSNAIVERFNRTLREKFRSVLFTTKTNRWIDYLDAIIENYNNTYHTTIKTKPIDVFTGKSKNTQIINNPIGSFRIGDKVRYSLNPLNIYSKASVDDKYTRTTFKIVGKRGYNYQLENSDGTIIEKLPRELQLVNIVEEPPSTNDSYVEELKQEKKQIKQDRILKQLDVKQDNILQGKREKKAPVKLDL